jgi:hypothetical protein
MVNGSGTCLSAPTPSISRPRMTLDTHSAEVPRRHIQRYHLTAMRDRKRPWFICDTSLILQSICISRSRLIAMSPCIFPTQVSGNLGTRYSGTRTAQQKLHSHIGLHSISTHMLSISLRVKKAHTPSADTASLTTYSERSRAGMKNGIQHWY